jgi:hypothetical protein
MREIILIENCFGIDVEVDGESLFVHEYDNRDVKQIGKLKEDLILKLLELKDDLGMSDWEKIAEVVVTKSKEFDYDIDNSLEFEYCEKCGNYNHKYIYKKIEDEKES